MSSSSYLVKKIQFNGSEHRILLQNENGPCPLLAAANVLLLRGSIDLPEGCKQMDNSRLSLESLLTILANRVLTRPHSSYNSEVVNNPNENSAESHVEHQRHLQQVDDLISILPSLSKGLDLNPKFTAGPSGYEYTSSIAVFDALGIDLFHGWLADPQSQEMCSILGNQTYNQLIDKVVQGSDTAEKIMKIEKEIEIEEARLYDQLATDTLKSENGKQLDNNDGWVEVKNERKDNDTIDTGKGQDGLESNSEPYLSAIMTNTHLTTLKKNLMDAKDSVNSCHEIRQFFEDSSSQLTHYGLMCLHECVNEESLCVFFRNDHFSVMLKKNKELFLLVTDVGYADVPEIVWESLDDIDGNTEYLDCFFSRQGVIDRRNVQYERELAAQIAAATSASLETAGNLSDIPADSIDIDQNHEDSDRLFAEAMQRNYEMEQNERAARMLQNEEYARQERSNRSTPASSSCILS